MGSASFGHAFVVHGTEKEFVQGLVAYITGLNSKIVCTSDIDDEFDETDLTHVPLITFVIDGNFTFTLKRWYNNAEASLENSAHGYYFSSGGYSVEVAFVDSWQPVARGTVADRRFDISHVVNDDFCLLTFKACPNNNGNFNIVYTASNSKYYTAIGTGYTYNKATIFNITNRVFTESVYGNTGTLLSRFAYIAEPGKIDYIKSAICMNNDEKVFEFTSVFDCTTLTVGDTVSLKDGSYMAVGPHQLVKMS